VRGSKRGWTLGAVALGVAAGGVAACGLDMNGLLQTPFGDDGGASLDAGSDATAGSGEGSAGQDGSGGGEGGGPAIEGGDDSTPPPPQDASPAPLLYDGGAIADPTFANGDWVKFCVGVTACFQAGSISRCMAALSPPGSATPVFPTPDMIACVGNQGPDCTAVAACLGAGAKCNPQTTADTCSGSSWVTCRFGVKIVVDCAGLGLVCSPGAGNAGCGFGDCYAWQQGQRLCAGQYVVECNHGRYEPRLDCQLFGLSCGGAPGQCQGDVSSCTNLDCAQLYQNGGFQCSVGGAGPYCSLGNQCVGTQMDTCDPAGHQAQFCNAGVPAQYDCHGAKWANDCQNGRCSN
jgi:hypothetical protein